MDGEVKVEERWGGDGQRGKERVTKIEGEEADGEIARDEVGKDKIRRIASQPTHTLFTSLPQNSAQFKDCQSRTCATQSLPH